MECSRTSERTGSGTKKEGEDMTAKHRPQKEVVNPSRMRRLEKRLDEIENVVANECSDVCEAISDLKETIERLEARLIGPGSILEAVRLLDGRSIPDAACKKADAKSPNLNVGSQCRKVKT
jgi:tetrahydromethanopterin S-methyltransferase subunit G